MVAVLRCVLVSSNRQMCNYPLVGFVWLCAANAYKILGMEYTVQRVGGGIEYPVALSGNICVSVLCGIK